MTTAEWYVDLHIDTAEGGRHWETFGPYRTQAQAEEYADALGADTDGVIEVQIYPELYPRLK